MVCVAAPFFILGSQGSGSTMLRLMLDAHPRIAVPPETGVMRLVTAQRWVPFWEFGGQWHERLGLSDADLDRRLGEFYGGLFADYAKRKGKERWGEKTPFHVWHVDDIRRLFPDAVFIGLARHPLGAVGSMVRRFDRRTPRATGHWVGTTREMVRQAAALGDRFALVRYEELTRDPEPVMRALLGWLGEPWADSVLSHHEDGAGRPRVAEGGTRTGDPVDAARIDRWRRWLDEDRRREVMAQAGDWAQFLGYGADPSDALEQLAADGPLVLGADVERRRASYPGLDYAAPQRPRRDDLLLSKKARRAAKRRRRGTTRRTEEQVRLMAERLPPSVQRGIRSARRQRRERGEG
jgi:hypothetical protein